MDMGSLQSVCPAPGHQGHPTSTSGAPYSHLSTSSYSTAVDEGGTLTAQEATEYLELSPKPERCSVLPEPRLSMSQHFAPTLGYMRGPVRSTLPEEEEEEEEEDDDDEEPEPAPVGLRQARLQSTPSSCYSEWDSSLWNTWSSVMDSNLASARTSLISSVDSCYTTDSAHLARLLAVAAETMSGASLSEFSPPASPLSALYPPSLHFDADSLGEPEPVPAWDWSTAWMEEMEAQYRARNRSAKPFDAHPC